MVAKDFRIGNLIWVLHEENESVITVDLEVLDDLIYNEEDPDDTEDRFARFGFRYAPIPLTEEILKNNCSFYIDSHEGVKFISIGRINKSMEIYFVIAGEILVMSIRIDLQFIDLGTRVKYLHQFQNLYKELTMGKELNIKL